MANLAALIREAERMRESVRIVGPEPDPPVPLFTPEDRPAPAPSWNRYREEPECASPEVGNEEKTFSTVQLSEEQMQQLRAAMAPTPEVMTLSEAAAYLRVGQGSVLEMVHDDGLPAAKLAGKWRFKRSAVDHWLEVHLCLHHRSVRH